MLYTDTGWSDIIVALATPPGVGAISIVRLSGAGSIGLVDKIFKGPKLSEKQTHTIHYGKIFTEDGEIDEVLVSLFKGKRSFTGEESVEISCHGSMLIQRQIIEACIAKGARLARPGEFTQRAFLNGRIDLAQAEAVGDIIAAETNAARKTALDQIKGGFSDELTNLRSNLIDFAALMELELDFAEEDVEFADRQAFKNLIAELALKASKLIDSFALGNVIKHGISVAIIGKPNAGKSTLLNALLKEDRAIVSDIAGTTRDTIEETININGVLFRLIDTAGIRDHSTDVIENIGITRSKQNAEKADVILHLIDAGERSENNELSWLGPFKEKVITVFTKSALIPNSVQEDLAGGIFIDAKSGFNLEALQNKIFEEAVGEITVSSDTVVTNARHQDALLKVKESLEAISAGLNSGISGDLLTIDIRRALHYLGEITGQVEVDKDILGTIFGKFCIGK